MTYTTMQKRSKFLEVSNDGDRFMTPSFIVLVKPTKGDDDVSVDPSVCVGYTASKKIGNAVARAKAKRRMRAVVDELIRLNPHLRLPKGMSGFEMVLIARGYVLNRDFAKMVREFKYVLKHDLGCVWDS